jgi:hypothetical protein
VRVEIHSYRVLPLSDTCHLWCTREGNGT